MYPKISAIVITYNEARNLPRFLPAMDFADEIILLDSFSTDETIQIAKSFPKVKIYERKFDNFSSQKNHALSLATHDWVVFFDADEIPSSKLIEEIKAKVANPCCDAYWIKRNFYFLGERVYYSGWQNDKAIRLFRKSVSFYGNEKFVHERLICKGKVGELQNTVDHFSVPSIEFFKNKLRLYARLKAEELFAKGKRPNFIHFWIKPYFRFCHHYIFRLGFLDGKKGFIIAKMHIRHVKERYKFLRELLSK